VKLLGVIPDGSVLLVKNGTALARNTDALLQMFERTGRRNIVVIVVDSFDELMLFDELKMRELGWHRLS